MKNSLLNESVSKKALPDNWTGTTSDLDNLKAPGAPDHVNARALDISPSEAGSGRG